MSNNLKTLLNFTHTLNVLFTEDNYDVRVQLLKLLENFFTKIDVEIDGSSATNRFNEFKKNNGTFYDLIITDLSMPNCDGIEFCKNIVRKNPNQTILVISAHTESDKLMELIDIGIFKFLQKPVSYKDLLNTIFQIAEKIKKTKNIEKIEDEVIYVKNNNMILNKLAITDKLTTIYNRRYLDNYLLKELQEIESNTISHLSLIFIDIDDFKDINDKYGHLVGDNILIELTNLIKTNIRKEEVFGRWGGEEFIIICRCTIDKSVEIAEKLRKLIENSTFTKNIKITASFGLGAYERSDTMNNLIQKADFALYQSKKNGKNRIHRSS